MSKDIIHFAIRAAFEDEGWYIRSDPFRVELLEDDTFFDIDLAATKLTIGADIPRQIVAIEVKSFIKGSVLNSFHEALGQYLNYRAAIEEQRLDIELFLAISEEGWERISAISFIRRRIRQYDLRFVIVNIHEKKVTSWIT